jgi:glutamyl-tRNA reductase
MHILCLGLNHNSAPLELREKLAFSEQQITTTLARLGCGDQKLGHLDELVILSTCNRVELYAAGPMLDFPAVENFFSEAQGAQPEVFTGSLYRLADFDATYHLLEVAAGLDSMVVGEPQILGQVTQAFSLARSQDTAGKVLSRLFQTAIRAGKRARTETTIAQNPASVASVAVRLASQSVPDLEAAQIVLLGAGEMAESMLQNLQKRGAVHMTVLNRTRERAQELARRFEARAATFEQLPLALQQADILLTSTGAPHTLIFAGQVQAAMLGRPDRPLVFIDIAVPRDVADEVRQIPNVWLYDLDSLNSYLEHSIKLRRHEIPQVRRILDEEAASYQAYLDTLDVLPIIAGMRQKAEAIRQGELARTLRHIENLSAEERGYLEAMTIALVKKLLHEPIQRLRAEAGGPDVVEYSLVARALFGLETIEADLPPQASPAQLPSQTNQAFRRENSWK